MRGLLVALVDVASGLIFVVIAMFDARVLLQSRPLVYLAFPLLCGAALAIGWWRGRTRTRPPLVIATLASVPLLIVTLAFFSGRTKPFVAFPVVTLACVAVGAALARSKHRPSWIAGALAASGVVAGLAGPFFVTLLAPGRDTNEAAVPFVVRLTDGRAISSRELRGSVVVLDFWATWCVPCRRELPAIQRVYDRLRSQSDVAFFAIDGVMTDTPGDSGDTAEGAAGYFHQRGYTIPLAWDGGAVLEKDLGVHGFPTLLVLDREGRVRMRHVGFVGGEDLEKTLLRRIDEIRREPRAAD